MTNSLTESQKFIFVSKYAKWLEEEGRRETAWKETADRYLNFMRPRNPKVPEKIWKLVEKHLHSMGAMASMRAIQMAGPALARNNVMGYNCSFVPFETLKDVVDLFYILMCGTGVGFSTELQFIEKMPIVATWTGAGVGVYVVPDSTEGWADSLLVGLQAWFGGKDIEFDYSLVRPRGARLKTKGGRASGPGPLKKLHDFCRDTTQKAQGRKLNSLEWLDIGNMIGEIVVVGGVRRASEINFSDLTDDLIRHAKDWSMGPYPVYRKNSNNSAVYPQKPTAVEFMAEWAALAASGSGERGIFNLSAVKNILPDRRHFQNDIRTNPCCEILLRPRQFCNLSEVVVRAEDDFDDLIEKVKAAVWLGAIQASMTDFPYIHPDFKKNCEEERLLGVSLTGQMDNPKMMTAEKLQILKKFAIKECHKACETLGQNMSAAITCGKPSGTVSQLVHSGNGAGAWFAKYMLRRYRLAATDPVYKLLKAQGLTFEPEIGQRKKDVTDRRKELIRMGRTPEEAAVLIPDWTAESVDTWVCAFPIAAPKGAITRDQLTAIDQLEWYLKIVENWTEHNQSITVFVKDEEWIDVGAWVYKHFDRLVGVAFLPFDGGKYELAPYEALTREEYLERVKTFPVIDYSRLSQYEAEDTTTGAQQLACTGSNGCDTA